MIQTGHFTDLTFHHDTPQGWYLSDALGVEILLPNKYCPNNAQVGDTIHVFIYRDSEDRLVATTRKPFIQLHQFAYLQVIASASIGSFMDWGLEKDLFVPFKEQHKRLIEGESAVVFLYRDESTDRLLASAKISKWLQKNEVALAVNTEVSLLCFEVTAIGYKMVIDQKYQGMVFNNESFRQIKVGDSLMGYVRLIRENGHIDVSLTPIGRKKIPGQSEVIMKAIETADGFLPMSDKSSPAVIHSTFGMSKKAFKEAIGRLYKARKIVIEENGLRKI